MIIEALASIVPFDTTSELPNIKTPILIMVGSEDDQLPVSHSEKMHAAIPDSRLEVLEGSGHFMMVEDPDRFYSVLDSFLEKIGH